MCDYIFETTEPDNYGSWTLLHYETYYTFIKLTKDLMGDVRNRFPLILDH